MKIYLVAVCVTAITGCAPQQSTQTQDAHVHNEPLQITAYSDNFEVFAEAKPFVVGRSSDILAHFTHLEDFKPLEGGEVTASLVVGEDGIRQSVKTPSKAGIYSFALTPTKAGQGAVIFEIGGEKIIAANIIVYTDTHDAEHAAADAIATSSNGALYTKEQSWKVDFATELSRTERTGAMIDAVGKVSAEPSAKQSVAAKSRGVAYLTKHNLVVGTYVRKGEKLAAVVSSALADDNMSVKFKEAEANYNFTKSEYERNKSLIGDKIVSETELLQAENAYLTAKTTYENLRENFSAQGENITAPMSGYIASIALNNGDIVESGEQLFTISQNNKIFITAEVGAKYFSDLENISDVIFTEQSSGLSYTLTELSGKAIGYGRELAQNATLIPVTFSLDNSTAQLLAGSFVNVDITTKGDTEVVTIPRSALIEEMGNYFVYKQLTPEFFEKTSVTLGRGNPLRVEIKNGLNSGERVVSKGAILVKISQAAGALDPHAGHVH